MDYLSYSKSDGGITIIVVGSDEFKRKMDCVFHNRAPTKSGNQRKFFRKVQLENAFHFDTNEELQETFRRIHEAEHYQRLVDEQRKTGVYSYEDAAQRSARRTLAQQLAPASAKAELERLIRPEPLNLAPDAAFFEISAGLLKGK